MSVHNPDSWLGRHKVLECLCGRRLLPLRPRDQCAPACCTANVQRWNEKGINLPAVSDFNSDERSDFGEIKSRYRSSGKAAFPRKGRPQLYYITRLLLARPQPLSADQMPCSSRKRSIGADDLIELMR